MTEKENYKNILLIILGLGAIIIYSIIIKYFSITL